MYKSGKAEIMRNRITGAVWSVSYNYSLQTYSHQPLGALAAIRDVVELPEVMEKLEPAGTSGGIAGLHHRQNLTAPLSATSFG